MQNYVISVTSQFVDRVAPLELNVVDNARELLRDLGEEVRVHQQFALIRQSPQHASTYIARIAITSPC